MLSHAEKAKSLRSSSADDEFGALDAGLLIAAPLACVALAGCAYHLLHQTIIYRTSFGPRGLVYSPYLTLVPGFALCGWYGASLGRNGMVSSWVGACIALFATMNFRGSFYWPGTFDMDAFPLAHTVAPMVIGMVFGTFWASRFRVQSRKARWVAAVSLLAALGWTWFDAKHNIGTYSLDPYSLHLALIVTFIASMLTAVLVRFASE